MNTKAVDFVSYTVSDLAEAVPFYRDTLGLTVEFLDGDIGWAEFAAPPTTIALGEADENAPISPGGGGVGVSLAVDDVDAAVDELRAAGHEILMDPVDTTVCDMAMIEDPDGNPVTLHRRHDGTHGRTDPFPDE